MNTTNDKPLDKNPQKPNKAVDTDESCYCVCHSSVSSNSYCEHCKGINEVGAVHNPILKEFLTQFTQELIEGLKPIAPDNVNPQPLDKYEKGYNFAIAEATQSIKATLTKYTGGK